MHLSNLISKIDFTEQRLYFLSIIIFMHCLQIDKWLILFLPHMVLVFI